MTRICFVCTWTLLGLASGLPGAATAESMTWDLAHEYLAESRKQNPNSDSYAQPTWHFLRTTSRVGKVQDRKWLRDGKYVPLEFHGARLFDLPVEAWVKHPAGDYRQPVIGRFSLRHNLDLQFQSGDVFFAPGHDDACVLGWRSPVAGVLEIRGSFQHAEKSPANNRGVQWYIERGPAPNPASGFNPQELASGTSQFGNKSGDGAFHIEDQRVAAGDFFYFIVDARADGSNQPQRGDFTRLRARLTMRHVEWPSAPRFERDILPVLAEHCHDCHGADVQEGALDLRSVSTLLQGGKSGPAIVPGKPLSSYLVQLVQRDEMPPQGESRLTAEEVSKLSRWIQLGAPADEQVAPQASPSLVSEEDRSHWAFQKLVAVNPPSLDEVDRVRTPVDQFLLSRLQSRGLGYAPAADRVTLVRRAYLDLIGLPPTPREVDDFMADSAPGAFGRLVDRLLESHHYGERWARHWLDVVGYADTVGFDQDALLIVQTDGKWRYRDYVIDAFNNDKPYDRFILEQLAGDEIVDWRGAESLTPEAVANLIATGFLRTARDQTHEPESNIPLCYYGVLHDTVQIVCNSLLGLSVQCARCHSHKFDPIPQEDYYRLMAAFTPAYNPDSWRPVHPYKPYIDDRALIDVSASQKVEIERHNARLDEQIAALNSQIKALRDVARPQLFQKKLALLPAAIRDDLRKALEKDPGDRDDVQKYLVEKLQAEVAISPEELVNELQPVDRATVESQQRRIAELEGQRRSWGKIQALFEVGPPPPTFVLRRGQYQTPGPEVEPGFLRVLCASEEAALSELDPVDENSSGRRTALAKWLVGSDTPASALVARVMVNRIWQHLFGQGLVPSPDDFGRQGERPTHPELLEWLCGQFVDGEWRIKPLVKLIMTSNAYQQASQVPVVSGNEATENAMSVDPGNELLWRMRLRRLEAEVVRDSILSVSGRLDTTSGGPPVLITAQPDGKVVIDEKSLTNPSARWRRSVYLLVRRAYNLSMLSVFDQPLISTSCAKRDSSAVPLQSLTMLNDEFVTEHAAYFAQRVMEQTAADPASRITTAFRIALARRPTPEEFKLCAASIRKQIKLYQASGCGDAEAKEKALAELCHTLLNTSEFLYAE